MTDSVTEDTGFTARGHRCFPPPFPGLGDTSVLQNGSSLSQAAGAWSAACLVGTGDWDRARAMTGAKLFLNRTRKDAAGVPAVDSVSVPVEPFHQ